MPAATKPFDPNAVCPKCLHDKVHVQFSNGRSSWNGGCAYCPSAWSGEHIDRRCQQCGYKWAEVAADAQRASGSVEGESHDQ